MEDVLFKYMNYRFRSKAENASLIPDLPRKDDGPVITVSRETGCSGNPFVKDLCNFLNNLNFDSKHPQKWQWVNKEIIYETANELEVHPKRVYKLFRGEPRKLMDEIVESLSARYYINDRQVTKAVREIVKRFAAQGRVIILGRGGVGLTRHIKKSLHIKLYAPKEWRIDQIAKKLELSHKEAKAFVERTDKTRNHLIEKFTDVECSNDAFDLAFNTMSMKSYEIFNAISGALKAKEIQ